MSIRIQIGTSERDISDIESNWVNEQINRRKKDGVPICVRISIKQEDINISLATNDCPKGGGGGRPPNKREKEIFDLWDKLHLNQESFSIGNLIAFLKKIS
ncbi:MAG: hypothetical protein ACLFV2_11715 [Desulfurivibrionaceae bacterium]